MQTPKSGTSTKPRAVHPAAGTSSHTSFMPGGKLSVGSILSRAYDTLMKNPVVFIGLNFAVVLPSLLLKILLTESDTVFLVSSLYEFAGGFIIQGAISYAVFQVFKGRIVSAGEALRGVSANLVALLGTAILLLLGLVIGLMALIVPGLILMCVWYVAVPACVVERLGAVDALKRSASLTKGYRMALFGLSVLIVILMALAIGLPAFLLMYIMPNSGILQIVVESTVQAVSLAYSCVIVATVYYDLRAVKEGNSLDSLTNVID